MSIFQFWLYTSDIAVRRFIISIFAMLLRRDFRKNIMLNLIGLWQSAVSSVIYTYHDAKSIYITKQNTNYINLDIFRTVTQI